MECLSKRPLARRNHRVWTLVEGFKEGAKEVGITLAEDVVRK
jgi:hypothetical protein